MTKKRRRGHARRSPGSRPAPASTAGPAERSSSKATSERRARKKQLGREAREAAAKQARRRSAVNRGAKLLAIVVAGIGVFLLLSPSGAGEVSGTALEVARAAGCDDPNDDEKPEAPGGLHNPPFTYDAKPATSGAHASPLPDEPRVFDQPIAEANAVHNLEHAFVILYYRADGKQALAPEVVDELETVARSQEMVFAAPYDGLPEGTSLSMAAWNKLWNCPGDAGGRPLDRHGVRGGLPRDVQRAGAAG